MTDYGKSQCRQTENIGNSPCGQTGYPFGSRGNAYHEYGTVKDVPVRASKDGNLSSSSVTPAGSGSTQSAGGHHYFRLSTLKDALNRYGKSNGLFGGKSGTSGATQANTGPLPFPPSSGGTVTYYSMRRTDTAAANGYSHWVNTTGDATGAPSSVGSVGPPVIITTF